MFSLRTGSAPKRLVFTSAILALLAAPVGFAQHAGGHGHGGSHHSGGHSAAHGHSRGGGGAHLHGGTRHVGSGQGHQASHALSRTHHLGGGTAISSGSRHGHTGTRNAHHAHAGTNRLTGSGHLGHHTSPVIQSHGTVHGQQHHGVHHLPNHFVSSAHHDHHDHGHGHRVHFSYPWHHDHHYSAYGSLYGGYYDYSGFPSVYSGSAYASYYLAPVYSQPLSVAPTYTYPDVDPITNVPLRNGPADPSDVPVSQEQPSIPDGVSVPRPIIPQDEPPEVLPPEESEDAPSSGPSVPTFPPGG